ncbi:MAG: PSD1 and planctomycete cytochrome C domain-containing protein [Planctomycetaceae bacterium]
MIDRWLIAVTCVGSLLLVSSAPADEQDDFKQRVQPLLERHCYECHSHRAKELQGGLTLDSRSGWVQGGETGPAIVPGKPDESLLIKAVRRTNKNLQMPPDVTLKDAEIELLVEWVRRGAVDPRESPDTSSGGGSWTEKLAQRRKHWCWQPVKRPRVPEVKQSDWSHNPIDRFVLARLEAEGLSPSRDADAWSLARRVSFVLTGLPPVADGSDDFERSHEQLVDRTLASPHFGEHWARHWMDLVRYSDTHGSEHDPLIPHAWRYRDYLIRTLNSDLPYDRFVREHLAGDLLSPRWNPTLGVNESPIGTGWFRFVEFYPTPIDVKNEEVVVVDAQIDAFSKTFQGLTIACARCHDHKFDAISAHDFAALYGIFASTRTTMHRVNDPVAQHAFDQPLVELKRPIRRALAELWREQLTHWPTAILTARDRVHEPDPPKPTDKDKPAAPMPPPFAPGTRSAEAESFRWLTALKAAKSKPAEPLNLLARLIPPPSATGATTLTDAIDPTLWTALTNERRAGVERRATSANRFRWFAEFTETDAAGLLTKSGDWFATDNFQETSVAGDFAVLPSGSNVLTAILPRSRSSYSVSNKQGGTLRSPNFTLDMKFVSVLAGGTNGARVRLVIENFVADGVLFTQVMPTLNEPRLRWITLPIRAAWAGRRAYLEIIPRDEMPYPGKHPDASILNTDGRSGVAARAVAFHDQGGVPELSSPMPDELWSSEPNWPSLVKRLTTLASDAISAWSEERCSDEQARFVDELLRTGVLLNEAPADHELSRLIARFRELEAQIPVPMRVSGVADEQGFDERLFPRGNHRRAGASVPRRYLEVLAATTIRNHRSAGEPEGVSPRTVDEPQVRGLTPNGSPMNRDGTIATGSGRRELAEAIVDPLNPLTARVMVNRLWQHVFGVGLVKSVDNFGVLGEPPSHPELLDWLAAEFVESGWSIKHLLRLMLTSRTFQLSSEASPAARERDPNNRLLSHASVRRLEAESLRDSLLFVSGRLDRRPGGLGVPLPLRTGVKDFENPLGGPLDGNGRRSVYLEARRNYPQSLLIAFDQPKPVLTIGERSVTNVPAQSLAMLNDKFVAAQSGLLAQRVLSLPTVEDRIRVLWLTAFARPATDAELTRSIEFLKSQATVLGIAGEAWQTDPRVWNELAHALINTKEFLYLR